MTLLPIWLGRDAPLEHYYRKQELTVLSRGEGGYDLPHTWVYRIQSSPDERQAAYLFVFNPEGLGSATVVAVVIP
jgi:hypothetical protein